MRKVYTDDYHAQRRLYVGGRGPRGPRKPYGCLGFLFDATLTLLTGGLWLIWIFIREMRNR